MTPQSSLNKLALPPLPPRWSVVNWEVQLIAWCLVRTNRRKRSCPVSVGQLGGSHPGRILFCFPAILSGSFRAISLLIIQTASFFQGFLDLKIPALSWNHKIFKCFRLRLKLSVECWHVYSLIELILHSRHFSLHVWSTTCEVSWWCLFCGLTSTWFSSANFSSLFVIQSSVLSRLWMNLLILCCSLLLLLLIFACLPTRIIWFPLKQGAKQTMSMQALLKKCHTFCSSAFA